MTSKGTKLAPKIVMRKTAELIPYARNSKRHPAEQITQVAASIQEFGFTNPILLDGDSGVIAGHCRLAAAVKLGLDKVPCIEMGHFTEEQKKLYILVDNKLGENGQWDDQLLSLELADLQQMGVDIGLTGFSDKELKKLSEIDEEGAGESEPEVALKNVEPVTLPGDTWKLGVNRLACKDDSGAILDELIEVWQKMTQLKAVLVATGQTYTQVREQRLYGGEA